MKKGLLLVLSLISLNTFAYNYPNPQEKTEDNSGYLDDSETDYSDNPFHTPYTPCIQGVCPDIFEQPEKDPNFMPPYSKIPDKVFERLQKVLEYPFGNTLVTDDPVLGSISKYESIFHICINKIGYVIRMEQNEGYILAVSSRACQ